MCAHTRAHVCTRLPLAFHVSGRVDQADGQIQPHSTVIKHDRAGRKTSGPRLLLAFAAEHVL